MKKVLSFLFLIGILLSCRSPEPAGTDGDSDGQGGSSGLSENESRLVALGDSMTMGIMDGGLAEGFQRNCYPYLIAKQWGEANTFQQPYITEPGIGVPPFSTPLDLVGDEIIWEWEPEPDPYEIFAQVLNSLENADLDRPYNNLAVNGAELFDLRSTTGYENSEAANNFFFDIVLRNLALPLGGIYRFSGKTMVDQAGLLEPAPEIILLWIGNNDVLGAVLAGGDESRLTDPADFEAEFTLLLDDLIEIADRIVVANIPDYIPFPYAMDSANPGDGFKLCDPLAFLPIDFPGDIQYPFAFEENGVEHITLFGGISYFEEGYGVPEEAWDAWEIEFGKEPVKAPLPAGSTITADEEAAMFAAVDDFNVIIADLVAAKDLVLVDTNAVVDLVVAGSYPDHPEYVHEFIYLIDRAGGESSIFSLDGVHASSLGHALFANAFIETINGEWGEDIPLLNPDEYLPSYDENVWQRSIDAVRRVRQMYLPEQQD